MHEFNQLITTPEVALDLAIWLEKEGEAFYQQALAAAGEGEARTIFAWLAGEEQAHCRTYKALYEQVTGEKVEQEELVGEYGHFINMLIGEVLSGLELDGNEPIEDLLRKALHFEEKTLGYFQEIRARFPGEAGSAIDAICIEEQKHIDILRKALAR